MTISQFQFFIRALLFLVFAPAAKLVLIVSLLHSFFWVLIAVALIVFLWQFE